MNATLSVQDLWSQILALPAGDRHWLASKLYDYEEVYEEEEERLTPYTMEEINAWIDESEADEERLTHGLTKARLMKKPEGHTPVPKSSK